MIEHKYYVHTPTGIKAECISCNNSQIVLLKKKGGNKGIAVGCAELEAYWKPITELEFWNSCPATTSENSSKIEETPQNVKDFTDICNKMVLTYKAKNHDYGNSFHNTFKKYGIVSSSIKRVYIYIYFIPTQRSSDVLSRNSTKVITA